MPLPEDFFDTPDTAYTSKAGPRNIFPTYEEEVEEKGSAYDAIGQALWSAGAHFISGGTMGLSEFISPTKAWEEKTTAERIGAAVGEAAGFFVPMKIIGTGVRGAMALGKTGSKRLAKKVIESSVSGLKGDALKATAAKGLTKGVFSKEGKRLLYQHELGGEVLERVNKTLMNNTEAALTKAVKDAKLSINPAQIKATMKSLEQGLLKGKHINSVSSWMHGKMAPWLGSGPVREWLAKYTGEFAQDAVVLGLQGVMSNAIHSAAREDIEFEPGSSLKHALLLSAAFPAIRSFGGGGERKMGELWGILKARNTKTDYSKITDPEDLRGLLGIITGGNKGNLLKKTKWTARPSGKDYHVDDFKNVNVHDPKIYDDLLDVAKQIQGGISKIDGAALWGKAFLGDTFNPATLTRMAVGAAVMNLDMFSDNAAMFRHLPPEEVLTHFLIGAMMSRGKGGWARDPNSRSADYKAEEINNYYQLMHLLGIDHSTVSEYVRVKNYQDVAISNHMGLTMDEKAKEIESAYAHYETPEKMKDKGGNLVKRSSGEMNDIIVEYKLLRDMMGLIRDKGHEAFDYDHLTPKDRSALVDRLESIEYEGKPLNKVSYNKFMDDFGIKQADISGVIYKDFLKRLGRESYEGADDKVLDMNIDERGILMHGGINWENESNNVFELYKLLTSLDKRAGLAIEQSDYKMTDFAINPKALKRLDILSEEFRSMQKELGLGDGVDFTFDIGDPDSNPFLREWLNLHKKKGQTRIADITTRQNIGEMEKEDSNFMKTAERELRDPKGGIISPEKYRVISDAATEEGKSIESENIDYQDGIWNIAKAFHAGAEMTRENPSSGNTFDISEDVARILIGQYEALNTGIPISRLGDPENKVYIKARAMEAFDARPEHMGVMEALREANLIQLDKKNGRILVNSDEAIRMMAEEDIALGIDPNQAVADYKDIVNHLPSSIREAERGRIDFIESGREPNIGDIRHIRKMVPKIFQEEIGKSVEEVFREKSVNIDEIVLQEELDNLKENLGAMKYDKAFKNLDNLEKSIPGFEKRFGEIYEKIVERQNQGLATKMSVLELSDGTGDVYTAIQNYIGKEKAESEMIERLLSELVYKGKTFRAANDYNKLVDTLSSLLGARTPKVSLNSLFQQYLKTNTYEDLSSLMKGLNHIYVGRKTPNELDNLHLIDSMEQMFQNYVPTPTKTKVSIAREYGLLDGEGMLKPRAVELLREGSFDELKSEMIPAEKNTKDMDAALVQLSEIVRNSRDQKIVRFTDRIDPDGKVKTIREWVMPWDNVEFNTPSNLLLDKFNDAGVPLFPISKAGTLNGRYFSDISSVKDIKSRFENNTVFDVPDTKYIDKIVKNDGRMYPEDEMKFRMQIPGGFKAKMRFVELSFGRPVTFVENDASKAKLDNMYRNWFDSVESIFREKYSPKHQENFNRIFDPDKVKSIDMKIMAIYNRGMNDVAFDKSISPEAIELMTESGGHYDLNMSLLKYNKLGEGGSLKALPNADRMELLINSLPDLPGDRVSSIRNIINDLRNPEKQIGIGFYDDKSPDSPLIVRTRVVSQIDTKVSNNILRQHLKGRYSDTNRFKSVMDESSVDGAQYIDTDMRNLFLALGSEPNYINGFKGSMAKSGYEDQVTLFGKGLFIWDPGIAESMQKRGVRFLMGSTAAKNFQGKSLSRDKSGNLEPVRGRIGRPDGSVILENDIMNLHDNNIMKTTLEGISLRFSGHLTNNAPVPHPYTHYMPEDLVVAVGEGWQMLSQKINEVKGFSDQLKRSANMDLAVAIAKQKDQGGPKFEQDIRSFAENMLLMGWNTRNPVVKEAVMKMWEEQALPILLKPRNSKFAHPFIIPDLKAENPVSIDLYRSGALDKPVGATRIQLGETSIGEDAKFMPVGSINELVFSFRQNDIDYIMQYNNKSNEFKMYTPAQDFLNVKGVRTNITDAQGKEYKLEFVNEVPKGLREFMWYMDAAIKDGTMVKLGRPSVYGSETKSPSQESIQRYIEDIISLSDDAAFGNYSKNLKKYKFHLVTSLERGPRKGASDFVPERIRIRSKDERRIGIGTAIGVNALDTRSNLQADNDGDRGMYTHDFAPYKDKSGKWDFLRQAFRLSSNNEEYTTVPSPPRAANIWGISKNIRGDLTHAGTVNTENITDLKANIFSDQLAVGKIVSMQSAIEWASLGKLSIANQNINKRLGFSAEKILENGDMHRRFEKGNQTTVDFIKGLPKELREQGMEYMLFGEGEDLLKGKLFDFEPNSIEVDVVKEVLDILRVPTSIFNQVFSDTGGKNANAYDIQSYYSDIVKFFSSPNAIVFDRLINKYRKGKVPFKEQLNRIVPLFFETEQGKEVYVNGMEDLRIKVLAGKARPNRNVINFGVQNTEELIRKSNVGKVMDEIVQNDMFQSTEMDLAWADVKNISRVKAGAERFIDEITLMKVIGISNDQMLSHIETAFRVGREKFIQNQEKASLLYDLLQDEHNFITNKLEFQLGNRHSNKYVLDGLVDRLDSITAAQNVIEAARKIDILKGISETQDTRVKTFKRPNRITNRGKKALTIYSLGKLTTPKGEPNWKGLKYLDTIQPGRRSEKLIGKYLVLNNPIIGHRLSRETSLEGYTWNAIHNSTPQFVHKNAFDRYKSSANKVAYELNRIWSDALTKFRNNKGHMGDYFGEATKEKTMLLNNYFKAIHTRPNELPLDPDYNIKDLGDEGSLIYYKAKLLLKPHVMPRQYIKGDYELPYLKMNDKLFKEVFTWLNDKGQLEVASRISAEYNQIKNYYSGFTNERTFDLHPSPLYETRYNFDLSKANSLVRSLMDGIPDAQGEIRLRTLGIGRYEGEVLRMEEGEYEVKDIRNMFNSWKEPKIDKRKTCRPWL